LALERCHVHYQPVHRGKRWDIAALECTTDQLKYKVEPAAA
jgi:hypothetical protein